MKNSKKCVAHLRNILHALQLVVFSNVYIWKLWWFALAFSGFMLDLQEGVGLLTCPHHLFCAHGHLWCLFAFRSMFGNKLWGKHWGDNFMLGPASLHTESHLSMGALPPELLSSSPTLLAPCPVLTLPFQTAPSTSSSSPPSCRRTGSPAFPEGGSGRSHTTTARGNKKRSHRCTPST